MRTLSEKSIAIKIRSLSKRYKLNGRTSKTEDIVALHNIDMDIYQGDVVGIVGPNGSGKSTLLKIISEVTFPDTGFIEVYGKVASILEVGTGFNADLSGRENIYLNARLHGMKKKEVDEKFNSIVNLFGFNDFVDTPIKHYSSGMYMRLAFAIIVHIDADIYLFDEVLNVGDIVFQERAFCEIEKLKNNNKTILIVTHSPDKIINLSNWMVVLNKGEVFKISNSFDGFISYVSLSYSDKIISNQNLLLTYEEIRKHIVFKPEKCFELLRFEIFNKNYRNSKINCDKDIYINLLFSRNDETFSILIAIKNNFDVLVGTMQTKIDSSKNDNILLKIPKNTFNPFNYNFDVCLINEKNEIIIYYSKLINISLDSEDVFRYELLGYINVPITIER